jgi:2-isopropylmalate synthase
MVQILDATLREGEQTPGVCFPAHAKLEIADCLDRVGVDVIEAGHPVVSDSIRSSVATLANRKLNACVGAHARSTITDVDLALECAVDFVGVFYCVSDNRLSEVFRRDLPRAIEHIQKVIRHAKERRSGLAIRYTPEDTVRSRFENTIEASVAACEAGADIISIADTTGHMIPGTDRSMYDYVRRFRDELAARSAYPKIAIHCHDDRGLAIANALDGYRAGVDLIDCTVIKLGERAGLVDLATLLTILAADFGEDNGWDLSALSRLYRVVSRHSGVPVPVNFPVMGENAFKHCAGVHTHAAAVNAVHYQSLDPGLVGRKMEVSLDHMSGAASVRYALDEMGIEGVDDELVDAVLEQVKTIGQRGRTVDASELSYIVECSRAQQTLDNGDSCLAPSSKRS